MREWVPERGRVSEVEGSLSAGEGSRSRTMHGFGLCAPGSAVFYKQYLSYGLPGLPTYHTFSDCVRPDPR